MILMQVQVSDPAGIEVKFPGFSVQQLCLEYAITTV